MTERLHQLGFNDQFEIGSPLDVTPGGFSGLQFPRRRIEEVAAPGTDLGRFVRQLSEPVWANSPQETAHYLLTHIYTPFDQFDQEETWVLLLNTKNRITHEAMVYRGTVSQIYIRIAEIFKSGGKSELDWDNYVPIAIRVETPTPSPEDVAITRQINEAAKLLGVEFEDHIIVGENRWVSLRERGLGF